MVTFPDKTKQIFIVLNQCLIRAHISMLADVLKLVEINLKQSVR